MKKNTYMARRLALTISALAIALVSTACGDADKTKGHKMNEMEKPIIYIYPEEETDVKVNLALNKGELSCVYPSNTTKTDNSIEWDVKAYPDGTLINKDNGMELYSLYWEGESSVESDLSSGFVIKGADTADFLNTKLRELGLNDKEIEEFIIYWLPKMESNKYNIISFSTSNYEEVAQLDISPKPDNLIRVFMTFKASEELVEIQEQKLGNTPSRNGYTVVEWGGTEIK